MRIGELLDAASTAEVSTPEGLRWRIRRLTSASVSHAQVRLLALTIPTAEDRADAAAVEELREAAKTDAGKAAELAAADARRTEMARRRMAATTIEDIESRAWFDRDAVCGGVTHVCDEQGVWHPFAVRPGDGEGDGWVGVERLPHVTLAPLAAAIWSLSTDGGAAAKRIASFRGGG